MAAERASQRQQHNTHSSPEKLAMSQMALIDTPLTPSKLESHLWEAANILRGSSVDRPNWTRYILPLLFFKRIYGEDFADEHRFRVPEKCHWYGVRASLSI